MSSFIERANEWNEPNVATVPMVLGSMVSAIYVLIMCFPHYYVWSVISQVLLVLFWSILWTTVWKHPAGRFIRKSTHDQKEAWEMYDDLPETVKLNLPPLTYEDILQLDWNETSRLQRKCQVLVEAYKEQQSVLRSPTHLQFEDSAEELTKSLKIETKQLRELA